MSDLYEKALCIHRVIKCRMEIRPGDGFRDAMQAFTHGQWSEGQNLMLAIHAAFKIWQQRWRVQRERDILDASALDLDTTCVDLKPPGEYFAVPEGKEKEYAEVYDIIQEYRCAAFHHARVAFALVGYVLHEAPHKSVVGEGGDLVERARSFRDKMEARRDERRKKLADRLGIN